MVDLSEQRSLDQELREMNARLIDAREQERIRLSRELHDDVVQRVALLSGEVGILRQHLTDRPQDIQDSLFRILAEIADIGVELHRLSRDLHPIRLQQLGLEKSVRCFCADLARAHGIAIDLEIGEVPTHLGTDATLCLYRITQEALHNIVKHSAASHATVALTSMPAEVVLRIVDNGVGFDLEALSQKATLGFVSMRERARLVHARLLVWSKSGEGTVIEVRVPEENRG